MSASVLGLCALGACTLGLFCLSHVLARVAPLPRPLLGPRGLRRRESLAGTFAVLEPLLRWLAALIARAPLARLRLRLDRALVEAGDLLGLCADELLALGVLGAGAGAGIGAGARAFGASPMAIPLGSGLFALLPLLSLREASVLRQRHIARRLPMAIDLMALCMDAGLHFVGALELVAEELEDRHQPLACELRRMLQALATGRTRRMVLADFAARVPTPAVREFANAVAQADQKGNPLCETLELQAQMLRMRRSVAAEEAAARASVMLILPLVLLMGAILLLLFGPFLLRGMDV